MPALAAGLSDLWSQLCDGGLELPYFRCVVPGVFHRVVDFRGSGRRAGKDLGGNVSCRAPSRGPSASLRHKVSISSAGFNDTAANRDDFRPEPPRQVGKGCPRRARKGMCLCSVSIPKIKGKPRDFLLPWARIFPLAALFERKCKTIQNYTKQIQLIETTRYPILLGGSVFKMRRRKNIGAPAAFLRGRSGKRVDCLRESAQWRRGMILRQI